MYSLDVQTATSLITQLTYSTDQHVGPHICELA